MVSDGAGSPVSIIPSPAHRRFSPGEQFMSRRAAIFALFLTAIPSVLAALEETRLRNSTTTIMQMQRQGKLAEARNTCEAALPLAGNADAGEQATFFAICGNLYSFAGELTTARMLLENALNLWEKLFGATHHQIASTTLDLARVHRMAGRFELSEQHARRALRIYEESSGPDSLILNEALINLGAAEIMLGRYADAELNLNRALSLLTSAYRLKEPEAAPVFSGLGLLYFRQERYLEAEHSYRRAGAILGSRPESASNLASLARVFLATKRYDKADAACVQALDLLTRFRGPDHAEVAATLQILAQVRQGQKRYAEAVDLLKQALDIAVRVSGPDHFYISVILNSLGTSYFLEGRYAEAEASFRRAMLIQEKLGSDGRKDLSVTLHNLAMVYDKQGRPAEALDLVSRSLAMRGADLPNMDSVLMGIMLDKAKLLRKAHRKSEAAKLERTARQAGAGRNNEDPHQWMVDFRELQSKK
jgi:tetratricopeptide (TPR) repeat protein